MKADCPEFQGLTPALFPFPVETHVAAPVPRPSLCPLPLPSRARRLLPNLSRFVTPDFCPKRHVNYCFEEKHVKLLYSELEEDDDGFPGAQAFRTRADMRREGDDFVTRIVVEPGTSFYGTGEVCGPLQRNGQSTVLWNTDNPNHDSKSDRMYQAHPFVLGVRKDGSSFGVIFDTTSELRITMNQEIEFIESRGKDIHPVFVMEENSPQELVKALSALTGKINMPPFWSIGFHQCRWSYFPELKVREVTQGFRKRGIPCDVIWMDIDYMDGFRIFTHDPQHFPDPKALNEELRSDGFHSVWMIDPGVKVDPGYSIYDQGTDGNHWVKTHDGKPYTGKVWPGDCAFPDFTMRQTREWWGSLYRPFLEYGADGVWNDMNEPAVFDTPTLTMPIDNVHRGEEGDMMLPHSKIHNVYGMLMSRATHEGILKARPNKRPFVLTRATHLGGQRYAATWTGDNQSNWEHLAMSIPMMLNLGMSGQPFSGPDIGGFSGESNPQLFARWMGICSLFPFSRAHTHTDTGPHEPWEFGSQTEQTCRVALKRRYLLLPHFYTLFYHASQTGLPITRPLFFADPSDASLRSVEDSFLIGDDILVSGDVQEGVREVKKQPVLPGPSGSWQHIRHLLPDDPEEELAQDLPEMYLRTGSIVPIAGPWDYIGDKTAFYPEVELLVSLSSSHPRATGQLYEDSGDSFDHLKGDYLLSTYEAELEGHNVRFKLAEQQGSRQRPSQRRVRARIFVDGVEHRGEGVDGEEFFVSIGALAS